MSISIAIMRYSGKRLDVNAPSYFRKLRRRLGANKLDRRADSGHLDARRQATWGFSVERCEMKALFVLGVVAALSIHGTANAQVKQMAQMAFQPDLSYNPTCAFDGTTATVPNYTYEDKVYGYVRYCAVQEGDSVRVKLMHKWTNGHRADGDTVCSAHAWVTADGSTILKVAHRVGVNPDSARFLADEFVLSRDQFMSVQSWNYLFEPCPKKYDKNICINSSACNNERLYYP